MDQNGVDYSKLRALGVPEEAIAALDARDGGNIDPSGNVLFLDADRQKRKEHPEKPLRKNKRNGLGIRNSLARYVSKKSLDPANHPHDTFQLLVDGASWPESGIKTKLYRSMMGFNDKGHTYGVVCPLDLDLSEATQKGVLPLDLVYQAIEEADYLAVLHGCVCRKAFDCKDHPQDLGCIFVNMAGRRAVETGIAAEATVEEAKAQVQRAKVAGLVPDVEFVEIEQFIWGFRNDQMNEFRMICFCCSCCCLSFNVIKNGSRDMKERFASCGYTAVVDHDKCVGCGKCAAVCPVQCISYREAGRSIIDQELCLGCGYCKGECENGALAIRQTMPLRGSINEYFLKEARIDDAMKR